MEYLALITLVFALVFSCIEAWKGSAGPKPTNFGWLAIALLIAAQIFFRSGILFGK